MIKKSFLTFLFLKKKKFFSYIRMSKDLAARYFKENKTSFFLLKKKKACERCKIFLKKRTDLHNY